MFSIIRRACVYRTLCSRARLASSASFQLLDITDCALLRGVQSLADVPEYQSTKTLRRFNTFSDTIDSSTASVVAKRAEHHARSRMIVKPLFFKDR